MFQVPLKIIVFRNVIPCSLVHFYFTAWRYVPKDTVFTVITVRTHTRRLHAHCTKYLAGYTLYTSNNSQTQQNVEAGENKSNSL